MRITASGRIGGRGRIGGMAATVALLALMLLLSACGAGNQAGAVQATGNSEATGDQAWGGPASGAAGRPPRMAPTLSGIPVPPSPESLLRRITDREIKAGVNQVRTRTSFTMPQVVGRSLKTAQDTLNRLGSYLVSEQDASGAHRVIVANDAWRVCSQRPKAGSRFPLLRVVQLTVVRRGETCPK